MLYNKGWARRLSDRDSSFLLHSWPTEKDLCIAPYILRADYTGEVIYATGFFCESHIKLTLDELKRVTDVRCKVTFRPTDK